MLRLERRVLLAVILGAAALAAAGCGGGGGSEPVDGKAVFMANDCWMCHHFTAAGSDGEIGPDLDQTTMTREQIEQQVRDGTGAMPMYKYDLSDEEIDAVVDFVVQNRRS